MIIVIMERYVKCCWYTCKSNKFFQPRRRLGEGHEGERPETEERVEKKQVALEE